MTERETLIVNIRRRLAGESPDAAAPNLGVLTKAELHVLGLLERALIERTERPPERRAAQLFTPRNDWLGEIETIATPDGEAWLIAVRNGRTLAALAAAAGEGLRIVPLEARLSPATGDQTR